MDVVKLDWALIRDIAENPKSLAVVRAVHTIAMDTGLRIVAEGVETEAQRDILLDVGIHRQQGFLYSRPQFSDELDFDACKIRP